MSGISVNSFPDLKQWLDEQVAEIEPQLPPGKLPGFGRFLDKIRQHWPEWERDAGPAKAAQLRAALEPAFRQWRGECGPVVESA
jgi:hypothetical protein